MKLQGKHRGFNHAGIEDSKHLAHEDPRVVAAAAYLAMPSWGEVRAGRELELSRALEPYGMEPTDEDLFQKALQASNRT